MAKGWKQHRLEANGQWQYTGQLTDQTPPEWLVERSPGRLVGMQMVDGVDTLGKPVRVCMAPTVALELPIGTLGWVQFTSAPEPRLPPGTPTSDYIPPGRD